jgi:hypothetical protein
MLRLCAEIRKIGFKNHIDRDRIYQLIDLSYEILITQPLGFKEFGDLAVKAQGATTGHSATTPDNTTALLACYMLAWVDCTGLRARDFFIYNTLANFGDDHVLGWDAVFGWTPQRAAASMAKFGITMRDEAPGQTSLPTVSGPMPEGVKDYRDAKFSFLSKKPLPMSADVRSELASAGVDIPLSFATCHDKTRLIGKIKGQELERKANNVLVTYDSYLSYLYLTAHHKDVYDELIQRSQQIYFRVREQVTHSVPRTYTPEGEFEESIWKARVKSAVKKIKRPPKYNEVLRLWYSAPPFPYLDEDLTSSEIDDNYIYIHTHDDPFMVFVKWISDFPTLLSPRYKNLRWADWIQAKLSKELSWPINFVAAANGVSFDLMTARLLLSRTNYSFLRNEAIVINDYESRAFGRSLLRHWIYTALSRGFTYRKSFSPLDLVRGLDHFWINLVFMVTGRISQIAVELDLHILDTIIIVILSFVHIEIPLPPILLDLLSPSILIGRLFSYIISTLTPAGAIDFQPFDAQLRRLAQDPAASFSLSAPTGVGKSTRLINRAQNVMKKNLVVIVPRRAIAVSVGKYMQSLYPESGIGISTEGYNPKPSDRIVYCTVQSFFSNPLLREPNNIFVLDEAHINEPTYSVARRYFDLNSNLRKIFITATPLDSFKLPPLVLPATSQFRVLERRVSGSTMQDYLRASAMFANDRTSHEKILIFVPTIKHMDDLAMLLVQKVCRISSRHKILDNTATAFISTSVADAGLTIPDVSFVISPDLDVTVSRTIGESGVVKAKPHFFALTKQTITQRRGRTGRTCDGTFLLFEITDLPKGDLDFTLFDFMESLVPATSTTFKYFPEHLTNNLPVDFHLFLEAYDFEPHFKSEHFKSFFDGTVRDLEHLVDMFGSLEAYWKNYTNKAKLFKAPRVSPNPDPDAMAYKSWEEDNPEGVASPPQPPPPLKKGEVVTIEAPVVPLAPASPFAQRGFAPRARGRGFARGRGGTAPPPKAPVGKLMDLSKVPTPKKYLAKEWVDGKDSETAPDEKLGELLGFYREKPVMAQMNNWSVQNVPWQVPERMARINVSGAGLLCGARACVGLIYTFTGRRYSDQLIQSEIWESQLGFISEPQTEFFSPDVLGSYLRAKHNILITVMEGEDNAVEQAIPAGFDASNSFHGVLYLEHAHYNYLGIEYKYAPIEDA